MTQGTRWIAILSLAAVVAGCAGATGGQTEPTSTLELQRTTSTDTADAIAAAGDAAAPTATTAPPDEAGTPATTVPNSTPAPARRDATELRNNGIALASSAVDGLLWMREEEKLARDVYETLSEMWDLPIFGNIAESEQAHTDAVGDLLVRYRITDPMADDTPGVFVDPTIQGLYDDLVEQGSQSLVDALVVGATIEDMDIYDLQLRETGVAAIDDVYANLEKGSRNHLRAFIRTLERQGGVFTPTFLGVDEYEAIINSPVERGRAGA